MEQTLKLPFDRDRIVEVPVTFVDFAGQTQRGTLEVLDVCAPQVKALFQSLHHRQFPLHSVVPMHQFGGVDSLAMAANNTSGFNFRAKTDGSDLSVHSYGTALDINPVQNPYLATTGASAHEIKVYPPAGSAFLNRRQSRLGKVSRPGMAEEVVDLFAAHGFYYWGGYWDYPIDYQHFELSRRTSVLLVQIPPDRGRWYFENLVAYWNTHHQPFESHLDTLLATYGWTFDTLKELPDDTFRALAGAWATPP